MPEVLIDDLARVMGLSGVPSEVIKYFIYDSIKVSLLLVAAIFLVSIVRTFITREKIKKFLSGKKEGVGNVFAALLGIPTPFCSCSAVPVFIGMVDAGVPLGVTFSFLIASPMINEVAVVLLFGLFGWKITTLYIFTGLVIAIVSGIIIGRMGLEGELEDFGRSNFSSAKEFLTWGKRLGFAGKEVKRIFVNVFPYLLVGIALGSVIHGYAPQDFLMGLAGPQNPLAVPAAVLVGIPLYSNAAGTLPIIEALISKGMAVGTALALMMSITAISLPELVLLRRVLKPKLLAIFVAILFAAFVITGIIYNAIL